MSQQPIDAIVVLADELLAGLSIATQNSVNGGLIAQSRNLSFACSIALETAGGWFIHFHG
jgi:hypothetical protein